MEGDGGMKQSYIYRKGHSEVRLDDPNWMQGAVMKIKGYELISTVDWRTKK